MNQIDVEVNCWQVFCSYKLWYTKKQVNCELLFFSTETFHCTCAKNI